MIGLMILALSACSGSSSPVVPGNDPGDQFTSSRETEVFENNRVLWGFWDISIDAASGDVDIIPMRTAEVNVNVTQFLQPPVSPQNMISLELHPDLSEFETGYFVLDVGLRHPFVGLGQYRGFDVRGIFMSDANHWLPGDNGLLYADEGDSHMLNPDGWTRWWNSTEFTSISLFGFFPGKMAPPNFPTAILNPYKYFCDDLDEEDTLDLVTTESRGTFSPDAGIKSRRYEIQFLMDGSQTVFDFNYAVDASWEELGPDAPSYEVDDFPLSANCQEAWLVDISTVESTLWYSDPDYTGGELVLDVTVHDWQALEDGGSVADEVSGINLYSPLFPDDLGEMFALGATLESTGTGVATWRLNLDASLLELSGVDDHVIWVGVVSSDPVDYKPQIDGGDAWAYPDGPLAAFMRGWVSVGSAIPQDAPEVLTIDPDSGYVDTTLPDVTITGNYFIADGLMVEVDNGTFSIPVSNTTLVSDTEITCDLDLTGAEIDSYDVTVTVDNLNGPGTLSGSLEAGFAVIEEIDEYGWPMLSYNTLRNCLSPVNGPQTSNRVLSASIDTANAPETLLIGVDPDSPGEWLVYYGYYSSVPMDFKAYDAEDGTVKWTASPPSGYRHYRLMAVAPPNIPCPDSEQGTVYVWAYPSSTTTPEKIVALSAVDGSTLWEYTAPGHGSWLNLERFGLVLENGDFMFCHAEWGSSSYYMRCLDVTDGSSKWIVSTGFHQTPDLALSPDGDTVYLNCNSSTTLRAYDLTTEPPSQKWSMYLGTYCPPEMQSCPIVGSDGAIYEMGRTNRVIRIIDHETYCTLDWATPALSNSQSAWVQLAEGPDGSIYALASQSTYSSVLTRLDPSDGSVLNTSSTISVRYCIGMAIADDGKVYVGGRNSGVYCLDYDCSQVWFDPIPGCRFTDAALLDNGTLYVADTTGGTLYAYADE